MQEIPLNEAVCEPVLPFTKVDEQNKEVVICISA